MSVYPEDIMNKLLFCGDPHGQFVHIIDRVRQTQPAAVVLLGDLDFPQPFETVFAPILDLTEVWSFMATMTRITSIVTTTYFIPRYPIEIYTLK